MISKKTVFVVGAGASCELDLPAGEGLKGYIDGCLRLGEGSLIGKFADPSVQGAIKELCDSVPEARSGGMFDSLVSHAGIMSHALTFALSIDNYLDAQRDQSLIKTLGKIGIAKAILDAERGSKLTKHTTAIHRLDPNFRESRNPKRASKVPQTWHLKLLQLLTAGKPQSQIEDVFDDVGFIIFNYDRCLEYFMQWGLSAYYNVTDEVAKRALSKLHIIHPYGQVGYLPWQDGRPKVAFGSTGEDKLLTVSEGIQTFTESVESGLAGQVKEMVQNAETLVFMGFGFLPQNVELLTVKETAKARRVFFTSYGISDTDVPLIVEDLAEMLKKPEQSTQISKNTGFKAFPERGSCSDLMRNNWLRLTR